MLNKKIYFFFCLLGLSYHQAVRASQHEIAIGYGFGKEVEQKYRNQGIVLSGKFYRLPNIDDTLSATLDGTLAYIRASTKNHNHLATTALALALRAYFANPLEHIIRPYFQISFGPAYLSAKQLGERSQGGHFAFQTTLETGTEVKNVDFNLRLNHYCNAGIFHPNQGINLVYIFSIGYMF